MGGTILALDIATNTGAAYGDPLKGLPVLSSLRFGEKGASLEASFAAALSEFECMILGYEPDMIAFEAPLSPSFVRGKTNITTTRKLMGLVAVLGAVCHKCGYYNVREADVADIRQHFIGVRNMRSEQAKAATMAKCVELGAAPANDNEGDAFALWAYAARLHAA
jgi:hypothetical protein